MSSGYERYINKVIIIMIIIPISKTIVLQTTDSKHMRISRYQCGQSVVPWVDDVS